MSTSSVVLRQGPISLTSGLEEVAHRLTSHDVLCAPVAAVTPRPRGSFLTLMALFPSFLSPRLPLSFSFSSFWWLFLGSPIAWGSSGGWFRFVCFRLADVPFGAGLWAVPAVLGTAEKPHTNSPAPSCTLQAMDLTVSQPRRDSDREQRGRREAIVASGESCDCTAQDGMQRKQSAR